MSATNDDLRGRPITPATSGVGTGRDVNITQTNIGAADRVRWGPIWAGIFATVSTLFLLSLLGIAAGLSAYDMREDASGFGIGAGIWQLISVIVAFMVGGWVAGRTTGWPGRRTGWLNGALVWAVAIPLILMLLTTGISGIMSSAGNVAAHMMSQQDPQRAQMQRPSDDLAQQASAQMREAGETIRGAASGQREPSESTVNRAQGIAWWTFASFALGLGAAAIGGSMGANRTRESDEYGATPA